MSKCILNIIQREKNVDKVAVLFKGSLNAESENNDVKKMKICFWVEQCLHALFECQEDVNEITKNHTKAISGELKLSDFFVLAKIDFRGYVTF